MSPSALTWTYQPMPDAVATTIPWCVLYGDLSGEKRTSRYGRKAFAGPNSSSRPAASASMGTRTSRS